MSISTANQTKVERSIGRGRGHSAIDDKSRLNLIRSSTGSELVGDVQDNADGDVETDCTIPERNVLAGELSLLFLSYAPRLFFNSFARLARSIQSTARPYYKLLPYPALTRQRLVLPLQPLCNRLQLDSIDVSPDLLPLHHLSTHQSQGRPRLSKPLRWQRDDQHNL
jgi:hypothetical protein